MKDLVRIQEIQEQNQQIKGFSYIFDVDMLVKYIIDKSHFVNLKIPKIYWSPDNNYGAISSWSIIGYNYDDFVMDVKEKMKGEVLKTHEVISLVAIDTECKESGFLGILKNTVKPN